MAMSWELTNGAGPAQEMVTVTEHWYLTEDRNRVVREGDPDGRWLWASPGTEVPRNDALRFGALTKAPVEEAAVEPAPERAAEDEPLPEEKKAPQAANKAIKKAANKAAAEDK